MAFLPLKVFRRDNDGTLGVDGDSQSLYNNSVGRLKVSQWPGAFNATAGSIIAATTVVGPVDVSRAGAATVSVSGTFTGVNFIFEVSNDAGVSYSAIPGQRIDTGVMSTTSGVIATSTLMWDITPLLGVTLFRVRATAWATGTAVVTIVPGATAVENVVQLAPSTNAIGAVTLASTVVSGTVTANGGTPFATPTVTLTGDTGAKVATGNGATVTNANAKGVQVVISMGTVTGTTPTFVAKLQGSVDSGTTFYDIPGATTASITATGVYGITVFPGVTAVAGVATTGTTASVSQTLPRSYRLVWTIGGTTPSFTITNVQVGYIV